MGRKYKIVISDLHMGSGQAPGDLNPWESFYNDDKLAEFLHFYSTDFYEDEEVELIINGDFYDFLQVKVDGRFPDRVTERVAVRKLEACIAGHARVHRALREFVSRPKKRITVLPGNHDFEWVFPKVQERFCEEVCGARTDSRLRFVCDRDHYQFDGIQVHHGMQFEIMHSHDFREAFLSNDGEDPILNMPWGSIFIINVITRLKQQRPYIDKVHPFWAYLVRAFVFDPVFAIKLSALSVFYFVKTRLSWPHLRARLRQTIHMVREARVYPNLEHKVRKILKDNPGVHTVILGHTHVPRLRRFEDNTQYIDTGSWTNTISLDLGSYGLMSRLAYAFIEYDGGTIPPRVTLREWRGYHDIFRDIHF